MVSTNILMMFIDVKQPGNAKLCDPCKCKVLSMRGSDCPRANVIKMAKCAQSNTVAVVCGNAWGKKTTLL